MKIINKILFLILSVFILINSLGYIFLYIHLKYEAKRLIFESVNQLSENDLTLISIPKQNSTNSDKKLIWREDYEFEINGKMYDVIIIKETIDSTFYYCINDEREEELIKKFIKQFDENAVNGKSKHPQNVPLIIFSIQAIPSSKYELNAPRTYSINYSSLTNYYNSIHLDIPSPPPKIIV